MYSDTDCIAVVQLAGWMYGKRPVDVTTTEYKATGFAPSLPVFFDRFEDWEDATTAAENASPKIPTRAPLYYQSVAALRKAVTETGYPLTGIAYQEIETTVGVEYVDVINSIGPWTQAKRVAGIHSQPFEHLDV